MKDALGKVGEISQLLLVRLLIVFSIIVISGVFWEIVVTQSDYSILILVGGMDIALGGCLFLTTKASDEERQETIRDLFKK